MVSKLLIWEHMDVEDLKKLKRTKVHFSLINKREICCYVRERFKGLVSVGSQ